jgi:hypothetical protein
MTDTGARELPDDSAPLREANPFRLLPFQSERFPFGASILWTPRKSWVIDERLMPRPDIVIDQTVFEAIEKLRSAHPAGEAAGVLVGHLCECPWTRRQWVHAMIAGGAMLPADMRHDHDAGAGEDAKRGRIIEDVVVEALRMPDRGDALPVGWFRTREGSGCSLTKAEADLHARHFTEPWQFGTLILSPPTKSSPRQGVVFVSGESGELTERHWSFYERFDGITDPGARPLHSWVAWEDYTTGRPTVPAFARTRAPRARRRARPSASVPGRWPRRPARRRGATVLAASAVLATTIWQVFSGSPSASADLAPPVSVDVPGQYASPTLAVAHEAFEKFRQASLGYFDVSGAFLTQEVGCARLVVAYRFANDAFNALASALRDDTKPETSPVDGMVAETIREIEASFVRSGCGTP